MSKKLKVDYDKLKDNPSFCLYAWTNFNCDTDGKIKLCCNIEDAFYIKDFDGTPFELGKDSLMADIWNSAHYKDVRKKMFNGERIDICKSCYRLEDKGERSPRIDYNENLINRDFIREIVDETLDDFTVDRPPGSAELRLGNTCNLMCNSCFGKSSKLLSKERKEILDQHYNEGKYHIPESLLNYWEQSERESFGKEYKWHESDSFYEDLHQISWWAFRVYLTGGEPTLIRANHKYIDMLLEREKFHAKIQITTNLQAWDQSLSDKLQKFDDPEIQVSIDGFQKVNEYIRYPSKWALLEKNFDRILDLPSHVKVTVLTVMQIYNVLDLTRLLEWLEQKAKGKNREIHWYPVRLHSPNFLQLSLAPQITIDKGLSLLEEKFSKYTDPNFDMGNFRCDHGIAEAIKHYKQPFEVDWFQDRQINIHQMRKIMKSYILIADEKRGLSFKDMIKGFEI